MEKLNARLLNWASILDPQTKEQAVTTSSMPVIDPHLTLMPDAHLGKGATVGSVIPTLGAIIPAAVGRLGLWPTPPRRQRVLCAEVTRTSRASQLVRGTVAP